MHRTTTDTPAQGFSLLSYDEVNEPYATLVSRSSVGILACTLLGMGVGATLPPGFASLNIGAGLVGLMAYLLFEAQGRYRRRQAAAQSQAIAETRLVRNVRVDRNLNSHQRRRTEANLLPPARIDARRAPA